MWTGNENVLWGNMFVCNIWLSRKFDYVDREIVHKIWLVNTKKEKQKLRSYL